MYIGPVASSANRPPCDNADVAVVGGGASGVLTAIHVLSRSSDPGLRLTIFEPSGRVGSGLAYSTTDERHLLNVRARHMSAFRDIPGDFLDWAARTGRAADPGDFLPRSCYGDYLRDTLSLVAGDRLTTVASAVEDLVPTADGFTVQADGVRSRAASVVLALGNAQPPALSIGDHLLPRAPWHLPNPWDLEALRSLPADATVVLVGTGLTAIDSAITLLEGMPHRRVVMTSRHGLLPKGHVAQQSTAWVSPIPRGEMTADLLAAFFTEQVRAAARYGVGWRNVVDGLRKPTQGLWTRLSLSEQRRFLSTYARRWEVRRHRMAPEVAARLAAFRAEGRLEIRTGGLDSVVDRGADCLVEACGTTVTAHAVVNCTGPSTDITQRTDPLAKSLLERRIAQPDALRLGLACTMRGEVVAPTGTAIPRLFAVGPLRKGLLYESTAIPEIRTQAIDVAGYLGELASDLQPA